MNPRSLLIADDEESICFALSREARRHGLHPLVAADGVRATELAESATADLAAAILDVRMPRRDGISAALAILTSHPDTPFALMTAFGDHPLPAPLAAVRVFRKPFELSAFADWLAGLVSRDAALDPTPSEPGAAPGRAGAA